MSFLAAFIDRQFISEPPVCTASFRGKTVIVTGANAGLGLEACKSLVLLGASRVILACRNLDKAKVAMDEIQKATSCPAETLEVRHLDMSSYASILSFSDKVSAEVPRLDAFIANAGLMKRRFAMTEDNEECITTNVVSTALLAFLVHPKLQETAKKYQTETHFTVTASELYEMAKFKERKAPTGQIFPAFNDPKTYNMSDRYNTSKLLGMFVVRQVAAMSPARSSGVIVNCVAPGFCVSDLGRDYDSKVARVIVKRIARPTSVGARTLVYGASAGLETHGTYLPDSKITEMKGLMKGKEGAELQERVWGELKQKLEAIRPGVTSLA